MRRCFTLGATIFLALFSISALAFSQDSSSKPLSKESFSSAQLKLFQRLNVASAWKITKGDGGTLIGLVDTGYDFFQPDLVDRMAPGFYYPSGFHTDFYENVAHGTLVAGLIVANDSNTDGVSGLAPNCRIVTASQGMIEHTLI